MLIGLDKYELDYDYFKSKDFDVYPIEINLEPFDGGVEYEHKGGEGVAYCRAVNNLIPIELRDERGSYELSTIASPKMQLALIRAFDIYSQHHSK